MPRKPVKSKRVALNLKARCPLGPPYYLLVLDQASCEALALGSVNSRAQVEASRVFEAMQPLPLPADWPT